MKNSLKIGVMLVAGLVFFSYVYKNLPNNLNSDPFSNIYVECGASVNQFIQLFDTHYDSCNHPRQGSLHFVSENEVFFSDFIYTDECEYNYNCYEDKSLVTKQYFVNTSFDLKTRTFRGSIVFEKRLVASQWQPGIDKIYQRDYVIIFNTNFTKILAGQEESLYDDGSKSIRKYNYKNEEVGQRGDDFYYLIDNTSPHYSSMEE